MFVVKFVSMGIFDKSIQQTNCRLHIQIVGKLWSFCSGTPPLAVCFEHIAQQVEPVDSVLVNIPRHQTHTLSQVSCTPFLIQLLQSLRYTLGLWLVHFHKSGKNMHKPNTILQTNSKKKKKLKTYFKSKTGDKFKV